MSRHLSLGLGSPLQILLITGLILVGCVLALNVNGYFVFVLTNVALFALVGIGLNVLMGLTGQVSLGHVGFYAIGAYTMALLTTKLGLSFWLAWPAAALLSALCGGLLALPAMRVKGPYLAMITIAFGFVIENSIVEMRDLTGGQNGIMGIAGPSLGGLVQGERAVAVIAVLSVGCALAGFVWLSRGTWGAAMRAVRDSEIAAESVGLNPVMIKTMAFAVSALCAGAAGALFAPLSGMITPHTFGFSQSIMFVLVLMLGGTGAVIGPLAGALVVGLLPELLSNLEEYRLLFFGALLLVVLWVAPTGVVGFCQGLRQRWWPMDRLPEAHLGAAKPALSARLRQAIAVQDLREAEKTNIPFLAALPGALRRCSSLVWLATRRSERLALHPASAPKNGILAISASLSKKFGGVNAVSELSFAASNAGVTSLIGPNGAGKSTALNMVSGFYAPTQGSFSLGSATLAGQSAMHIARVGVARTFQTSLLFDTLSVTDNVLLAMCRGKLGALLGAAHLRSVACVESAQALLDYCGYRGRRDEPAANLAHVDRRLVEIARALALDPDALLLDEPAAGLSREDKAILATLLRRIADAGITVVLVEHDMTLVMAISDHIVVLDAGQWLAAGTPAEVQPRKSSWTRQSALLGAWLARRDNAAGYCPQGGATQPGGAPVVQAGV